MTSAQVVGTSTTATINNPFQDSSPTQSDYVISQTMVTIIYSLFSEKLW